MRWVRTYFLHNTISNYFKDIEYSHKTDPIRGMEPQRTETGVQLMLVLYEQLVQGFNVLCEGIGAGTVKSLTAAKTMLFEQLLNMLKAQSLDSTTRLELYEE
jgi:hypothetical protein